MTNIYFLAKTIFICCVCCCICKSKVAHNSTSANETKDSPNDVSNSSVDIEIALAKLEVTAPVHDDAHGKQQKKVSLKSLKEKFVNYQHQKQKLSDLVRENKKILKSGLSSKQNFQAYLRNAFNVKKLHTKNINAENEELQQCFPLNVSKVVHKNLVLPEDESGNKAGRNEPDSSLIYSADSLSIPDEAGINDEEEEFSDDGAKKGLLAGVDTDSIAEEASQPSGGEAPAHYVLDDDERVSVESVSPEPEVVLLTQNRSSEAVPPSRSDSGLGTGATTAPPEEKDSLETYSQFAETVSAEKKNDGATNGANGHGSKGPKIKSKNYASPDCGAKIVAVNPESLHGSKVIQSNKDEYMLNKCKDNIWFTVELCETIRPQKFDIANFELFSNLPKDIVVYGSHRSPTRDWVQLGKFIGQEGNRAIQSFPIDSEEFLKYIKVEIESHYGSEFFCPISLFRIYGISEFEVIDTLEDSNEEEHIEDQQSPLPSHEDKSKDKPSVIPGLIKNMWSSVLDVIKRGSLSSDISIDYKDFKYCLTSIPRYTVDPKMCHISESTNYIISCYYKEYKGLLKVPAISVMVKNDYFCEQLAYFMCSVPNVTDNAVYDSVCNNSYICTMLSPKHLLVLCLMQEAPLMQKYLSYSPHWTAYEDSGTSDSIIQQEMQSPHPENDLELHRQEAPAEDSASPRTPNEDSDNHESDGCTEQKGNLIHGDQDVKASQEDYLAEKVADFKKSPAYKTNVTLKTPDISLVSSLDPDKVASKDETKVNGTNSIRGTSDQDEPSLPSPPASPTPSSVISESRNAPAPPNKESVFMRLSNKIKTLEHNMSISSQYLEELSRRYKKQMEEMQRQFNLTINALNATSISAYRRDMKHQNEIKVLTEQLAGILEQLERSQHDRATFERHLTSQHITLMLFELLIFIIFIKFCSHYGNRRGHCQDAICTHTQLSGVPVSAAKAPVGVEVKGRRNSADSLPQDSCASQRQRRKSADCINDMQTSDDVVASSKLVRECKKKRKHSVVNSTSCSKVSGSPETPPVVGSLRSSCQCFHLCWPHLLWPPCRG